MTPLASCSTCHPLASFVTGFFNEHNLARASVVIHHEVGDHSPRCCVAEISDNLAGCKRVIYLNVKILQ